MASTPIPPSLDHLTTRPFSFYPPIVHVAHNEWLVRKATWSEIQVANCRSGEEFWIPRRFLGEVAGVDKPVLIVGLNRELELKSGMVVPRQRRIIEMPTAGPPPRAGTEEHSARPVRAGVRLERSDRRVLIAALAAVATLVALYLVALSFIRVGELRQKNPVLVGRDQAYLGLSSHDDFLGVTQKVGPPATDRQQESGTIFYRALGYPKRGYTVILMGSDQGSLTYIGTVDQDWHPIHSVNSQTESLLRQLPRAFRTDK